MTKWIKLSKYTQGLAMVAAILLLKIPVFVSAQVTCAGAFRQKAANPALPASTQTNTEKGTYGDILRYVADTNATQDLQDQITFGTYNINNLFLRKVGQQANGSASKDVDQRKGNARAIREINPDFQIVVEVENIEALRKFNDDHLAGEYEPLLIEGNDSRGIDIGILVRRSLKIAVEWRSFKSFASADGKAVFSRDLPVGLVYRKSAAGQVEGKPLFAIMGTHFKSKRVEPGQPDNTQLIRERQVLATVQIVEFIHQEFGSELPLLLAGDFNNALPSSPEFQRLFQLGFKDTLDLSPIKLAPEERVSHYYFGPNGESDAKQMDAILLLAPRAKVLAAQIIPNRDQDGKTLPPPKNFKEREALPSDHHPVKAVVQF